MSEQILWTDARIADVISILRDPAKEQCQIVATRIRDEYQARIDDLEKQLAEATRWQPVKDGHEIKCEESDWALYASEGDIGVHNTLNKDEEHYVYAFYHNLCLCQRANEQPA